MSPLPSILNRLLRGAWIAVFAAILLLPLFQQITKRPADKRLSGIRVRTREFPSWSFKSWRRGEFAATADAWIRDNLGLRGHLICINRQIRYSLFRHVEPAPLRKRAIVIGRTPVLFENILLVDALRPPEIPPDRMEDFAFRLARMQRLLSEQGMAFLVILAPNKAYLYPDDLPAWTRNRLSEANSDHVAFIEAMRRHQVAHLDSMALFRELDIPDMVPPHGIHWSNHGAWVAWQHAVPEINRQGVLAAIPLPQTEELVYRRPTAMNDELRAQLNLYVAAHAHAVPSAYPVAAPLPPGTDPMLGVLVVGDSFGFTLVDALARSRLCHTIHYWFYMMNGKAALPPSYDSRTQQVIRHVSGIGAMSGSDANGRRMLENKNLVLLVFTTFNIDKYTWGFDRLVNRLYGDPNDNPPLDEVIEVNLGD